ncbi:hypothetical protein B0T10DRAFT_500399 [Thelonectria olida]|uniref:AB hydrolase-1 domain-containing protein n=1 Tax=Thelonectria olida TaxID=1576542 RepID=A0A9P8VRQ0_9HYPO|nr:hypothetical protein B0T10DRAFT_500399 [Thelonectria olida]
MSVNTESPGSDALRYVSDPRFHRTFTLPASSGHHDDLIVSYADLGRAPDPDGTAPAPPTVLFMPGMFASRYLGVAMHVVAEKLGVRVLVVDRPGMGKSTDVPLDKRVSTWVELVPRLLQHLGIPHVALASHSAGTVFLLNTLSQCRDVLHPTKPFAALLAPFVDPACSKVTSMQLAKYVPVSAFSIWHLIPQFFVLKAGPAFASSGTVVTKASGMISGVSGNQDTSELEKNRQKVEKEYGMSRDLQAEIDKQVFKSMFDENTVGANSEALQCLKKSDSSWGQCSDFAEFVKGLVLDERRRRSSEISNTESARLKVRMYFAEDDALSGKKGQLYVEDCWKGEELGDVRDVLDFESTTIPKTDHDSVMQSVDVLARVFIEAGGVAISTAE